MRWPVFISNRRPLWVAGLLAALSLNGTQAGSLLATMDSEVAALYAKSKDAVFKVHAELPASMARTSFGSAHRAGSGFFISADGKFVTTGTLVEGAATYWIDWRGQRVEAKLLGRDPLTNLALLQAQIDAPTPHLEFGNSDELRVGSMVVAIGFPYDQPSAPTVGFVTGLDIACGKRIFPVNYIRAGCRLQPGQGGGPLLNVRGEVAGLVIAARAEDQCYALPVNAVKKLCADITQYGAPQYGWVGLNIGERRLPTGDEWQVYIKEVLTNTPAALAGFHDRDILIRICTNEIRRSADVLNTMFYRRSGEKLKMSVVRQGFTQEFTIAVGKRPVESEPAVVTAPIPIPAIVPVSRTR